MGSSLLQPTHLIILLVIVLLLFGAKRLPEIGRSLGTGMREFKDSVTAGGGDKVEATRSELPPPLPAAPAPAAPAETAVSAPPAAADSEREAEPVS